MKFNFYNKKYASIADNRLVIVLVLLAVLAVSFQIYFQMTDKSDFFRNEVAKEQQCKPMGYKNYDKDVYCKVSEKENIDEDLEYLYCNEQEREEEVKLYKEVKEYTENEEECNELEDEECTCIMNAFFYQQDETERLLNSGEEDNDPGLDVIIGDKDTGQEEGFDFSLYEYSYNKLNDLFTSEDEEPNVASKDLIDVHTRIDSYTPLDLSGVERVLRRNGHYERMEGYLPFFDSAAQEYNINPYYLLSHFILETGYGQSRIWIDKNNGFGIGAYDKSPYELAYTYDSQEEGIREGAKFIAEKYIHNQGTHSGEQGPRNTLYKINFRDSGEIFYASDRDWAEKISTIANNFIIESDSYRSREVTKKEVELTGNNAQRNQRQINTIHPSIRGMASQFIENANEKGINLVITSGLRSFEEQNRLYAQGRTTSGNIVTNVRGGRSFHNYGLAIDVVEIRNGKAIWEDGARWDEIGRLGKEVGFEWGGDWSSFVDRPHFQYTQGLSTKELLAMKNSGNVNSEGFVILTS